MKNKVKKIIITLLIIIIVIAIAVVTGLYIGNEDFRLWANKNVLKKEIGDNNLPKIEIEDSKNTQIYAYSDKVVTLIDNTLTIYNAQGKQLTKINMQITNPKFANNGDYLLIADYGQSDLYLVYNDSLQWSKNVEGNISEIAVNKNGAVGVVVTGTVYKAVITMYDVTGTESFKTYLSETLATDLIISDDAKYLSFVEIDTSGVSISSKVKTISVEKAKEKPDESIVNTYELPANALALKIKFKKNDIIEQDDESINLLNNGKQEKIYEIDKDTVFADVNLNDGYICYLKENTEKLVDSEYILKIVNVESKKENTYLVKNAVKSLACTDDIIALNTGTEVEFVRTNGFLIKKYTSLKNIKNVILTNKIAAIISKDTIEIVTI